ncbi:hypothetical protein AVEN_63753-1 [Araneus ventricosus]|uniref:Uncharacterized protein n=1 Tax=Araneus ventricosus TaxID=182803 RepID=A0A4Y2KS37_ARAVE|nr:hypothetical protein AVEN_63753-1 [Araneus ventricosus]
MALFLKSLQLLYQLGEHDSPHDDRTPPHDDSENFYPRRGRANLITNVSYLKYFTISAICLCIHVPLQDVKIRTPAQHYTCTNHNSTNYVKVNFQDVV